MKRTLLISKLFLLVVLAQFVHAAIDKVVVHKDKRVLYVYDNGEVTHSFPVMLGSNSGPKRVQGDRKTPEGEYIIDWHNPNSRFYLSMHVNYPNAKDRQYARENGIDDPGNNIFIHGVPKKVFNMTDPKKIYNFLKSANWTNGCVALSNSDMEVLFDLIPAGTPLIIKK